MSARALKITGLILLAAISLYVIVLAIPRHDYFVDRVGTIKHVQHDVTGSTPTINETLHLRSSTGLEVDMRVRRPNNSEHQKLPVLLAIGGHRTGKDAVDLVDEPRDFAFAAIDYPYSGNSSPDGFLQSAVAAPKIQRAFLDTPPALMLALNWLVEQPWVDQDRIELVGASLGVPFAAVAGAIDIRFTRVWLLHGGADNLSWVEHAGRKHIDNPTLRNLAARTALLLVYGNSFTTANWAKMIAPRPLVIVSACDDDYVPREAQEPWIEFSESESVDLIWTRGLHIGPGRHAELQQLLDIVLDRSEKPTRTSCPQPS
jgi:fermentation-respiration switch protein FrsA (DUF1100 family)